MSEGCFDHEADLPLSQRFWHVQEHSLDRAEGGVRDIQAEQARLARVPAEAWAASDALLGRLREALVQMRPILIKFSLEFGLRPDLRDFCVWPPGDYWPGLPDSTWRDQPVRVEDEYADPSIPSWWRAISDGLSSGVGECLRRSLARKLRQEMQGRDEAQQAVECYQAVPPEAWAELDLPAARIQVLVQAWLQAVADVCDQYGLEALDRIHDLPWYGFGYWADDPVTDPLLARRRQPQPRPGDELMDLADEQPT